MIIKDMFSKQLSKDNVLRWLAFTFIALAVLISYYPSIYYSPRADQVIYMAETVNIHHPWDLIIGCYDHNRHRTIGPGDELLFRPLLYVILGSEQVLFGHHFWAWQLLGVLAHLTLIWVLLRLLWHLSHPWLAFAGAWIFALSVVNYELVTWPHLSSYVLMMVCIVCSIEQVIFCLEKNELPWKTTLRLLIYFFIACFIYETANIFVLLLTALLFISFPKLRGRVLLLTTPVILYLLFSVFNYTVINHMAFSFTGSAKGMMLWKSIQDIFYLAWWWLYEGMFNGMYHYVMVIRTMFQSSEVMFLKPLALYNPQVFLELVILTVFLDMAWFSRWDLLKRIKVLIVLLGMLFSYVGVIVLGRSQEMGSLAATVRVNSYFSYIFWVLVLIIAFLLIPVKSVTTKLQQWVIIIFVTACLLSGLWQGVRIHGMAVRYSGETNVNVVLIRTLDLLIQEKKSDPGFSFYVDPRYPGNYPYGTIRKVDDPPGKKYTFIELLYPQYFYPKQIAKYKFLIQEIN